ncbi:g3459 [Coccomyxa elongata]
MFLIKEASHEVFAKEQQSDVTAGAAGTVVGADLLGFLSQKRVGERVSANSRLRETYEETCRIAAAHSVDPVLLREGGISTERVFELMRESETGYVYLEYPSTVQVDPLDDSSGIGGSFGVQVLETLSKFGLDSDDSDKNVSVDPDDEVIEWVEGERKVRIAKKMQSNRKAMAAMNRLAGSTWPDDADTFVPPASYLATSRQMSASESTHQ